MNKKEIINAILLQLLRWRKEGNDSINFGALAIHPAADDETTFGDLLDKLIANERRSSA